MPPGAPVPPAPPSSPGLPAAPAGPQTHPQSGTGSSAQQDVIETVRKDPAAPQLPPDDSFGIGSRTIAAGATVRGPVAVVDGTIDVLGVIDGNADAINGDIVVHPGGHVRGDAFTAHGKVRLEGGTVDGEIRSLSGTVGPTAGHVASHGPHGAHGRYAVGGAAGNSAWRAFKLALAWTASCLIIGIGVLTFAEEPLGNVTQALADHFGRSLWYGLLGELAFGPALLAVVVALAITVIGIVVAPFAALGAVVLAVGAIALGFIAVAETTGRALVRSRTQAMLTPRGAQLRALVTGVGAFGLMWVVAACVSANSGAGLAIRGIVAVITIVAVTAGVGAVIVWRLEVRRIARGLLPASSPQSIDDTSWQTPTPVSGVAAARRPTPPRPPGSIT